MSNDNIPLYTESSPDWSKTGQAPPYAVGIEVGVNEYIFGRTTPNNDFVVASGLIKNPHGIEMIGGKKNKVSKTTSVKKAPKTATVKKDTKKKDVKTTSVKKDVKTTSVKKILK